MEILQVALIVLIVILLTVALTLAIILFLIYREIKRLVARANNVLDNTEHLARGFGEMFYKSGVPLKIADLIIKKIASSRKKR